jgi:hypothetical protein
MANRKRKTGQCVHCGQTGYISDDHLPPQNLFPLPRPNNLITVPSCDKCNSGASKDDEYFRLWLVSRENAKGHPARDAVYPTMRRSLRKKAAPGFAKAFLSKLEPTERFTPSGIYAGTGFLHAFEGRRIDKVAARITQGLFYHEKRYRLPDDHTVQPICLYRVDDFEPQLRQGVKEFVTALLASSPRSIGTVFRYWWLQAPNGPHRSVWLFEFYGRLEYFCMTAPSDLSNEIMPWPRQPIPDQKTKPLK